MELCLYKLPREILIKIIVMQNLEEHLNEEEIHKQLKKYKNASIAFFERRYKKIREELEAIAPYYKGEKIKTIKIVRDKFNSEAYDAILILTYNHYWFPFYFYKRKITGISHIPPIEFLRICPEFVPFYEYISREKFIDQLLPSFIDDKLLGLSHLSQNTENSEQTGGEIL